MRSSYEIECLRKAALELISKLHYFRRCWVRQELEAAWEVIVVCGRHSLPLADFTDLVEIFNPGQSNDKAITSVDSGTRSLLRYAYFRDCHDRWTKKDDYRKSRNSSSYEDFYRRRFFNVVMRSAVYESKLPQDRIFSVLNIIATLRPPGAMRGYSLESDASKGFPAVNYTKSTSAVFQDFIKHTINFEQNLDCLTVFQDRNTIGQDLPSWAIDLRVDIPRCQQRFGAMVWKKPETQIFDDSGVLVVRGQMIGHIPPVAQQSEEFTFREQSIFAKSRLHTWMVDCLTFDEVLLGRSLQKFVDRAPAQAIQEDFNYKLKKAILVPAATQRSVARDFFIGAVIQFHALTSALVQNGDLLVTLQGSSAFFVLREQAKKDRYTFLGPAMIFKNDIRDWRLEMIDLHNIGVDKDGNRAVQEGGLPECPVREFLLV